MRNAQILPAHLVAVEAVDPVSAEEAAVVAAAVNLVAAAASVAIAVDSQN